MRTHFAAILSIVAIATLAAPVTAQDDVLEPPVVIVSNEAFCSFLGQDVAGCEAALTGLAGARIVPEAYATLVRGQSSTGLPFPFPFPTPIAGPIVDGQVGDSLSRDDVRIKLVKVDWAPDLADSMLRPARGKKFVSALVRYAARVDGASYSIVNWSATDDSGARYEATALSPVTPPVLIGDLAAREWMKGWVTFEVPRAVNRLRLIESQDLKPDLTWSIQR